jgi:Tol biopolymer transport system component
MPTQIAGEQNLWSMDPNGGPPRKFAAHAGFSERPTVSPDGRYIVFLSNRNDQEPFGELILTASFDPNVSSDGKSIACGFRPAPADKNRFAVLSIDGGQLRLISDWPAL